MTHMEAICMQVREEKLEQELAHVRAMYLAAHEVLIHVAEFCDHGVVRQGIDTGIDMRLYRAMAAAMASYQQSIEAGAPVAWAVGVDA